MTEQAIEEIPIHTCPTCTFLNENNSALCNMCNYQFIVDQVDKEEKVEEVIEEVEKNPVQICPHCTYLNEHSLASCSVCNYKFFIDLNKEKEKRVISNYDLACKLIPTSMIASKSPFLSCSINGFEFKALVDTGATLSIMSEDLIEKCQLADILDKQYVVQVIGVGETKSVGKIYCVDNVMINNIAIPMSFTVLKKPPGSTLVIIGMDILASHGAIIDIYKKSITLSGVSFNLEDK